MHPPATVTQWPVGAVTSVASFPGGHEQTIFALAVDAGDAGPGTGVVASGGKDGIVALWDGRALAAHASAAARGQGAPAAAAAAAQPLHRFRMEGMFAIAVDAHAARRVLLAAWNGDESNPSLSGVVTVTDITEGAGFGATA
jgi:hypothetical protein